MILLKNDLKRKIFAFPIYALKLGFLFFKERKGFSCLCSELSNDDVKSYNDIAIISFIFKRVSSFAFVMVDSFAFKQIILAKNLPVDGCRRKKNFFK